MPLKLNYFDVMWDYTPKIRFITEFPFVLLSFSLIDIKLWLLYYDMEFHKYLKNKNWKVAINQTLYLLNEHWTVKYKRYLGNGRFLLSIATIIALTFSFTLFIIQIIVEINTPYIELIGVYCAFLLLFGMYIAKRIAGMDLSYRYDNLGIRLELVRIVVAGMIAGGIIIILGVLRAFDDDEIAQAMEGAIWIVQCCLFNTFMYITLPWVKRDMIRKSTQRMASVNLVSIASVTPSATPNMDSPSLSVNSKHQRKSSVSGSGSGTGSGGTSLSLKPKNSNLDFIINYRQNVEDNNKEKEKILQQFTSKWQNVITTSVGYEAIMNHVQTEFSTENLLFLTEVKNISILI